MPSILNLHRCLTNNIGDLLCAPTLYFDDLANAQRADLVGWHQGSQPDPEACKRWPEQVASASVIIVGGGGLVENSFFQPSIELLFKTINADTAVIVWGAGHNNWQISDWRKLKQSISLSSFPYALVGVRDYGHPFEWVPCPSCLLPQLDTAYEIKHEVAVYAHSSTLSKPHLRKRLPSDLPILDNSAPLEEVLPFLGSTQTLLTDSYHGAYWATLLGRKVVGFPTSSKIYDLKHAVPIGDPLDWERLARLSIAYPEALGECRQANHVFHNKVMDLIAARDA